MKNMSLKEIASACGGTYHGDPALLSILLQESFR